MAIVRPRWQSDPVNVTGSSITTGSPTTLFEITGGPGIIKGGGIQISAITDPVSEFDLRLIVDGVTEWTIAMDDLDTISANASTLPWTFAEATTTADFDFKENANLGFLTSVKLEIQKNTGAADSVDFKGAVDYHLGA